MKPRKYIWGWLDAENNTLFLLYDIGKDAGLERFLLLLLSLLIHQRKRRAGNCAFAVNTAFERLPLLL
jgi:hypothetical protein